MRFQRQILLFNILFYFITSKADEISYAILEVEELLQEYAYLNSYIPNCTTAQVFDACAQLIIGNYNSSRFNDVVNFDVLSKFQTNIDTVPFNRDCIANVMAQAFNSTLNNASYPYVLWQFITYCDGYTTLFPGVDWTGTGLCINYWHMFTVQGPSSIIFIVDKSFNDLSLQVAKNALVTIISNLYDLDLVGLVMFSENATACSNILQIVNEASINQTLLCLNSNSNYGDTSNYMLAFEKVFEMINNTKYSENGDILYNNCHLSMYFITNTINSGASVVPFFQEQIKLLGLNISTFAITLNESNFDKSEVKDFACSTDGYWVDSDSFSLVANFYNSTGFLNDELTRVTWTTLKNGITTVTKPVFHNQLNTLIGTIAIQVKLDLLIDNTTSFSEFIANASLNNYQCKFESLNDNYAICTDGSRPSLSTGAIIGIIVAVALIVIVASFILYYMYCRPCPPLPPSLRGYFLSRIQKRNSGTDSHEK